MFVKKNFYLKNKYGVAYRLLLDQETTAAILEKLKK